MCFLCKWLQIGHNLCALGGIKIFIRMVWACIASAYDKNAVFQIKYFLYSFKVIFGMITLADR